MQVLQWPRYKPRLESHSKSVERLLNTTSHLTTLTFALKNGIEFLHPDVESSHNKRQYKGVIPSQDDVTIKSTLSRSQVLKLTGYLNPAYPQTDLGLVVHLCKTTQHDEAK